MACAVGLSLSAQGAAQTASLPADVSLVLREAGQFTPDDMAAVAAGRVTARTEVVQEQLEASVVAAVRITTTQQRALDYFHQLVAYVDGQVTLQHGAFGRPPSDGNVEQLTLDPGDIADLRACRPDQCDVRVAGATPASIPDALDWRAPDAAARANEWMRRGLVAYVADYLRRGDVALTAYTDRGVKVDLMAEWETLLGGSRALALLAPDVQRHLRNYPAPPPPPTTEAFYWDKQHYTGLKPIIGVTHAATWRSPSTPDRAVVVHKQIYASRYVFGSLVVTLVLQDPGANGPVTYVVYTNRLRGDLLKSTSPAGPMTSLSGLRARLGNLGATVQRHVGEQLIRQSAERLMSAMKEALER